MLLFDSYLLFVQFENEKSYSVFVIIAHAEVCNWCLELLSDEWKYRYMYILFARALEHADCVGMLNHIFHCESMQILHTLIASSPAFLVFK